jgi:PAS domain S-box-containing protein
MPLSLQPPEKEAPVGVLQVGSEGGLGRQVAARLADGGFRVSVANSQSAVLDRVADDTVGPECVVVADDVPEADPLELANAVTAYDEELPVVLCTTDESAYDPKNALDSGLDALLTEAELSEPGTLAETVRSSAKAYRERVSNRQDASLLDAMLEELPVALFSTDDRGRRVRISSSLSDPESILGETDIDAQFDGDEREDVMPEDHRQVIERGESITNVEEYSPAEDSWYLVSKVPWREEGEIVGLAGIAIDITDRKEGKRQLRATTELLSTIVRTSPAAIVVHDDSGTVQFWNPAAEDLFGWTAEEAIREPLPPYVAPDQREEFREHIERVIEEGTVGPIEVQRRRQDGARLDLQVSAAAIESDNSPRVVRVLTDVTELKERERRLKRHNDRLESFATVLEHDLRNPIQVVRGQLDREGEAVDTARLGRAVDRIESVVEDVLSIAREEPLVTDTETLSLAPLARAEWAGVDAPDATLTVESDCQFEGESARVQRLLAQLFENAIEHGGRDVTVTVGGLEDGFFVADDGRGLQDDDLSRPFQPGYSTDSNGTGFGLNLVREITDAHGWTIELVDTEEGVRFEIRDVETPERPT